ncbi:MAG: hypothetical protein C6P37_05005 [Caldibacillus debilis]|uniref:HTH-like domain-containing protein n=1 Tax=Caldibacillus debilis TaxID=301148 RepID=A0A3E0K691_9BACI|nr:IS3 family transposase [Caldibacillus debilis]REJ11480.1 MAG: hypothetical protein C6W58_18170 [Bacillaceae bacterium]REJ15784.1 MAG: hypothetical protein C6W57_09975 [Caldibacillus debilis]REJ27293.1 MAG: hypothetical protein C6W56_10865 [Caldibacillus debilis]REJ29318.1 MAG: hypothetical protein C6P37_05005 [Caldibacillus debilis]
MLKKLLAMRKGNGSRTRPQEVHDHFRAGRVLWFDSRSQACFEAANTSGSNDRNTPPKRQLINKIKECHEEVKGICGYRRVQVWLKRKYHINYKRVQRLMKEMGIRAVIRKKRPYYGKKEPYVISANHLNRDLHASRPNEKWLTVTPI